MKIYLVNNKFYINDLDEAIEKAKFIIRKRYSNDVTLYPCNKWKITQGRKGGFCVKSLIDYNKISNIIGNVNYLKVTIRTIEIKDQK